MSALDKYLRQSHITAPEVAPSIKRGWSDEVIRARLDKLKMEAIHSGRIAPIIDFFDSLNVMVWNAFRVNFARSGETAEINRNRVLEIWEEEYSKWYQEWYQSLLVENKGGDFI